MAKGLLALGLRRGDSLICLGCYDSDCTVLFVAASYLGIGFAVR